MIKKHILLLMSVFLFANVLSFADEIKGQEEKQTAQERLLDQLTSQDILNTPGDLLGKEIVDLTSSQTEIYQQGTLTLPFQTNTNMDRSYVDFQVKLDLSGYQIFYLDITTDNPKAVGEVTLYFHSEKGWYSMTGSALPLFGENAYRFRFYSNQARIEETPASMAKIDKIRIAFWRSVLQDNWVHLNSLRGGQMTTVLLAPNNNPTNEPEAFTNTMNHALRQAGVSFSQIAEADLTAESLKEYKMVIVPIAGQWGEKTIDYLCDYVDQGGFLMLFYSMPERLMNKLGFSNGHYIRCQEAGIQVERIAFTDEFQKRFAPYLPTEMRQVTGNFTWAQPLENVDDPILAQAGNQPCVAAWWLTPGGEKTEYPAMLWSGKGLYFSHVLLNDDSENKIKFLLAMVHYYDPKVNVAAFCEKLNCLFNIGLVNKEAVNTIWREKGAVLVDRLAQKGWNAEELLDILADLKETIQTNTLSLEKSARMNRLFITMDELHNELANEYTNRLESSPVETRLWWEHSGVGPYPGDWDRTIKELAEAGFNGIIPNMLWGGVATYDSKFLPHDEKYEKYGDQIEQVVRAAKKYGVEVHVWKVNFNCDRAPQSFITQMAKEGRLQKSFNDSEEGKAWLCPSHPLNQDLEVATMLEVAKNYDVDGIHFDYIRYPNNQYCFCDGCKERFSRFYEEQTGKKIEQWPQETRENDKVAKLFIQWRCDQITTVVRRVHEEIEKAKLPTLVSAAVFNGYPSTIRSIGQDWGLWIEKGYLDFVCPMDYTENTDGFDSMVENQMEIAQGKIPLYPGIGATCPVRLSSDKLAAQIEITRRHNTGGFCIFDLNQRTISELVPAIGASPMKGKPIPTHRTKEGSK